MQDFTEQKNKAYLLCLGTQAKSRQETCRLFASSYIVLFFGKNHFASR